MIYTELTRKALKIAFRAHEGQLDRSGLPYILHPVHVAEQMKTEDTCVVAILHDVIEDTSVTMEDLQKEGFTETQLEGVRLMTHLPGTDYFAYVQNLKDNPVARAVKIADLQHNSDPTRLIKITPEDRARLRKYQKALEILGVTDSGSTEHSITED